jgi:ABC-2 type transport system permease protein
MTSVAYTLTDSATMLRRNLKHQLRYPSLTLMLAGFPDRVPAAVRLRLRRPARHRPRRTRRRGRGAYLTYLVPGILIITVASAALGTAISVATDMTGGITDRFRTMAISRGAVLTGHVIGSLLQTLAVPVLVAGVALALGFRSSASALEWLSAALGLSARSVETASNTPMFLTLLPFLSSAFVATATMPAGLRQFAEYEPFTPVTQTIRGLLTGGPTGTQAIAAIAWSIGIALASYLWAVRLYNRRRAATPN